MLYMVACLLNRLNLKADLYNIKVHDICWFIPLKYVSSPNFHSIYRMQCRFIFSNITTGDIRVNVVPGLGWTHTTFMREHNRVANQLAAINEHWDDETIFQQARRIIAAQLQVEWIVPQFLNLRPKMAKSIVYVITLITNRNHAFHCLN